MTVAAAGERRGTIPAAFPAPPSLDRMFLSVKPPKRQELEICGSVFLLFKRSWKSRMASFDSASLHFLLELKIPFSIKKPCQRNRRLQARPARALCWAGGTVLSPKVPVIVRSGSQDLALFKTHFLKGGKCQIISRLWLCRYNWRAFPSSKWFYIYT